MCVNWSTLIQELTKVLDPDKLHNINVPINTQLKIRCRNEISDGFEIDTGVPQALREKCPNTDLFLVRIFLNFDWIQRFMEYSVEIQENTDQE